MPGRRRLCPAGIPVHVIQRGNNRQVVFTSDKDIAAYANWLKEGAIKFDLRVHAWVFMTNHVHLLVTPLQNGAVSRLMQYLGRLYVRYFNYSQARTGTLFEGRFRSSLVQEVMVKIRHCVNTGLVLGSEKFRKQVAGMIE